MNQLQTLQIQTFDGLRLHGIATIPQYPQAVFVICHGLGEHIARYSHLFKLLFDHHVAVFGCDLRGHGKSGGKRGHIHRFHDYIEDQNALHHYLNSQAKLATLPRFQFGHSMGGLISASFALEQQKNLTGVVLSSPLLAVAVHVPGWKAWLGNNLSRILPKISLSNGINTKFLSHDASVIEAYTTDPLVHDRVTARWYTETQKAMAHVEQAAKTLTLPMLILHGGDDYMALPEASKAFSRKVAGPVQFELLEGFYHEIFNETQKQIPLQLLLHWLESMLLLPR